MRAAVLREYGEPLDIEEVPEPDLEPHGVVVDVEACGICRSDWHAWRGHGEWADDDVPRGQILGHEPAGVVVSVGDRVETVAEGDRIALPFNLGDGACPFCRTGHGNVCRNGRALGFEPAAPGAFAERVHLPWADNNAMPIPDGVPARDVAAIGCRFMTAYHALIHRTGFRPGNWVAVHGCGGVGLSAVHLADALGARVVAVDVRESALDRARSLGADAVVAAGGGEGAAGSGSGNENGREGGAGSDVVRKLADITDGGAHVSMDALGRAETCRNSVDCLRVRGEHVQVGLTTDAEAGEVSLPVDELTMGERSVHGSRGMPPSRYDELLGLIEGGAIDPGRLVGREVSLSAVPERLAAMTDYRSEGIEVVTDFEG